MTQPAPNIYGQDFWLGGAPLDFSPDMRVVTGRALLAQSIVCRLSTARGTVIDCPNDCLDLRDMVSDGLSQSQLNALGGQVRQEILKDQRVQDAAVTATYAAPSSTLTVQIRVSSLYGPFALVLSVTAVTVTILNANLPNT